MREIKFRAQQFNHGGYGFQYGNYVTDNKNYHAIVKESKSSPDEMYNILINPKTLGQFTGLQDKNDVDIYQGDIQKVKGGGHYWIFVVGTCAAQFGNALFSNQVKNNLSIDVGTNRYTFLEQVATGRNYVKSGKHCEIIGNIHENPELLTIGGAK